MRHHQRAELGVPGDSKGSLKQRALDGRMIIEIVRLCDRPLPSIVPRLDHGTQRDSMMLLLRVAAPPPRIYVHTACERDLAFARGGGGGGVSRFNLPLVNGREGGREKGAGAFEPPRGYENHGVEEHFFFPPSPSLLLFARSPQACSISAVSDCSEFRERRGAPFERVSGFWGEGGGGAMEISEWAFRVAQYSRFAILVEGFWGGL